MVFISRPITEAEATLEPPSKLHCIFLLLTESRHLSVPTAYKYSQASYATGTFLVPAGWAGLP
jgi:hypothetical protein